MEYLLDSNVVINYLGGLFSGPTLLALRMILNQRLRIATVTKIEVLGFTSNFKDIDAKAASIIALAKLYDLDTEVIEQTIKIRKTYKIKIADAIIAAMAITNGLTLLSRNTKDFNGIKGLKVIDPYTLK